MLGGALAGEAAGSASGTQHAVYSHTWRGVPFVTGLSGCPLFGPTPNLFYAFDDVRLTDHINSKYTPIARSPVSDQLGRHAERGDEHFERHVHGQRRSVQGAQSRRARPLVLQRQSPRDHLGAGRHRDRSSRFPRPRRLSASGVRSLLHRHQELPPEPGRSLVPPSAFARASLSRRECSGSCHCLCL